MGSILPVFAFAVALAGALPGLYLHTFPRANRIVVPFSGGLLLGVSVFGLLPDLAREIGWWRGLPVFAAGYMLLFVADRYVADVCPSCSHGHNHNDCPAALHGYTVPLACAAAAHAFLDGWGLVSVRDGVPESVRFTFALAVMLHKLPEGLALGAVFRASTGRRALAFLWCAATESATLVGGFTGVALTPRLGSAWTNYPLALAGGCFLYLGYHAVHGEWRRRGLAPVLAPAFSGLAGAALLQGSSRLFLR